MARRGLPGVGTFLSIMGALLFVSSTCGGQERTETVSCRAYSSMATPRFRIAKKYRADLKPGLSLFVSISPSDYAHDKLLALVCKLAKVYANEPAFFLRVFDSYSGAKRFNPQGEGNDDNAVKSFLAWYAFNGETEEQSFAWRPDPADMERWVTINLGKLPAGTPLTR